MTYHNEHQNTDDEMAARQERPSVRPEGRARHLTTQIFRNFADCRAVCLPGKEDWLAVIEPSPAGLKSSP